MRRPGPPETRPAEQACADIRSDGIRADDEDERIGLLPRIRHRPRFDVGNFDRFTRFPRSLDDVAVGEVLDAATGEGLAFSGLDELVLENGVGHAVQLNF